MTSYKLCTFGGMAQNVTRYAPVSAGDGSTSWKATEAPVEEIVGSAGTFKNLYVEVTALASGQTATFTLRVNGADTALTLTITGTTTTGSDTTHTVTVAAGDIVSLKAVTSATSGGTGQIRVSMDYTGDTANESLLMGREDAPTADGYCGVDGWTDIDAATFTVAKQLIATAGTVKKFYVRLDTAPGVGSTNTFTVYKNGSATALTITVSNLDVTGNDTSNSFTVAAGDKLAIFKDESAVAANTAFCWGMVFAATTDGEFPIVAGTGADPSNAATNYNTLTVMNDCAWDTTEDFRWNAGRASWITNMYVECTTAPGAGNSYTYTLRNNAADTALSVAIAEAATTGNDTEASGVAIANFDNLSVSSVPVSTPTQPAEISYGFTVTMTNPAPDTFTPTSSWFL